LPAKTFRLTDAVDLTGLNFTGPSEQGDCHPTTGKNYSISLVDSYSITGPDEETFIGNFLSGITPIMTIFFSNGPEITDGNVVAGSLGPPGLHLTCMKAVGSLAGCVGCNASTGGSTGISNVIRPTFPLAMMAAMTAIALMLF
jgi:hypothetical protein